jgi:response regulator RpfG family c-di-GMP phosphodiesterase
METKDKEIIGLDLALPPLCPKFLVVDDHEAIRRLLTCLVTRRYPSCDTAADLASARRLLGESRFDILLLDLSLADGKGSSLLEERGLLPPESVVIVITGQAELETAVQVIRQGAFDYISKPFSPVLFEERIAKAVQEWRTRVRCHQYQLHLEKLVEAMTEKVLTTSERIEKTYDMTVAALGAALDLRDPETEEHCRRVAGNSVLLGEAMRLEPEALRNLRWSSYLHDIGKIGIPEHILSKRSSLTAEERRLINEHPLLGFRMIRNIEFLKDATDVVLYHHEKYDGSGYPFGLKGNDIPIAARIFAVTDTMDAMLYDRPYRKALSFAELVSELTRQSGRHFDPGVVQAFLGFWQPHWNGIPPTGFVQAGETIAEIRR